MIILHEDCKTPSVPITATIGFFDGMHCGHRFLLSQVKDIAHNGGEKAMAVTFARHPAEVIVPSTIKPLLTTSEERCALIDEAGMNYCAILDFTISLSELSAKDFMQKYLRNRLNVRTLVVGYDHSFGHECNATFDDYRTMGESIGIHVIRAGEYISPDGMKISSTRIRKQLFDGNVEIAAQMLGRNYMLSGIVTQGRHVGRQIGFPTANIDTSESHKVVPANGVYAARAHIGSTTYAAVVNIGTRPTLHNGNDTSVEAHLTDFNEDIYGKVLGIEFIARLRNEKRFDTLDKLSRQIADDIQKAAQVIKKHTA